MKCVLFVAYLAKCVPTSDPLCFYDVQIYSGQSDAPGEETLIAQLSNSTLVTSYTTAGDVMKVVLSTGGAADSGAGFMAVDSQGEHHLI